MLEPEVLFDKLSHMQVPEIVALCEEQGVQGVIQEGHACALAHLFYKMTTARHVTIDDYISWQKENICDVVEGKCTEEMTSFIRHFDAGHYPSITWTEEEDYDGS
jgi:hypothetical protein